MEIKEIAGGKKPSSPAHRTWEGRRITSASELFERLNQTPTTMNQGRPEAQRDLTSSEFLEFLRKGPEAQFRTITTTTDGNSQGSSNRSHNKDRNHNYQTVAIDQCDITSSVDYGSRDYYCPSTHTSDAPYIRKENDLDDVYKTCTDTRGNWWQGSFYY